MPDIDPRIEPMEDRPFWPVCPYCGEEHVDICAKEVEARWPQKK